MLKLWSSLMKIFLATDGDYLITNDGAAQYEISDDNKTITITIGDNVNWHDGEPVKASDLLIRL